ncbi:hypothetical protein ECO340P2_00073 [Escherichia phage ECO340P2]|nr:hypothetical protein ECO340P2_00073 [Escherichia phage ECO340P2]
MKVAVVETDTDYHGAYVDTKIMEFPSMLEAETWCDTRSSKGSAYFIDKSLTKALNEEEKPKKEPENNISLSWY